MPIAKSLKIANFNSEHSHSTALNFHLEIPAVRRFVSHLRGVGRDDFTTWVGNLNFRFALLNISSEEACTN